MRHPKPFGPVEPVVSDMDQTVRAIVHIEQDRIILTTRSGDDLVDIADIDVRARVVEAVAEQMRERSARPFHDLGHKFAHDDASIARHDAERRAQGEAHAEPADQHVRTRATLQPFVGERR